MTMDPKVLMQLHRLDSPKGWEAEYSTSRLNTTTRFEAKTP
jgi:hypothetical protein